jgi:hypothetical protein
VDKKSLVALAQESAEIERIIIESDGELTPELEKALTINEINLPDKVEGYHNIIQRVELMSEHYKRQVEFYARLKKSCDNFETALKENIKTAMRITNTSEIAGNSIVYKLTNSNPKLIVFDEKVLPQEYKKEVVETVIDNKKIKDHLVAGLNVDGARLEPTDSLRKFGKKI